MSQRNIALQRMESQRLYSIIDINFIFKKKIKWEYQD